MNYSDTHREIVEACKKGEHKAQVKLYGLYSDAMYNTCLRMVKNEYDAQDILQSSFTDVFLNISKFKFESSIGAYIKRIVINNCINFLKKRKLQMVELDQNVRHISEQVEEKVDLNYSVEVIKKGLQQLSDGYRTVFSLYIFEGYDHKEIGKILDISEATSKSQLSRAKQKIRKYVYENLISDQH